VVTFDQIPVKVGPTWRLTATHPSGQQEHVSGFHTAAEALDWLASDGCAAWLRTRGYPPDAFPVHPTR
jgi:hypothetical protein